MKSDNEFYIIQKYFPNSFAKLGKRKYKSTYEQHSIELKALKDTKDSFLIPEDKTDPIIVIENQGYQEEDFFLRFNQGIAIYCYQNKYYGDVVKVAIFLKKKDLNKSIMPIYNRDFICYILSEMSKEELENFNDDALMSILPLCKITENELLSYTKKWKEKIENNKSLNKNDKLTLYGIYSYFCNETFNKSINQINKILEADVMITKLGKELYEKGRLEGIEEGIEKGIEEGIEKGIEEGIEKGIEKGKYKKAIETAKKMKEKNLSIEFIIEITGLTKEEIEKL